jgi:ubiquinone/menaquinone biosynthesis C-methylase UbiE
VASVHAVDISPAMTEALAERTADAGLVNVSTELTDLKDFRLPPCYADLIVSSYALHHLTDADKRALTARAARGLRPGGRLVIADMMFGRGGSRRDRAILRQKVAALAEPGRRDTARAQPRVRAGSDNFAWTRQAREASIQS